jgi:uncharacterized protein YqfB (UPF0267 family)
LTWTKRINDIIYRTKKTNGLKDKLRSQYSTGTVHTVLCRTTRADLCIQDQEDIWSFTGQIGSTGQLV